MDESQDILADTSMATDEKLLPQSQVNMIVQREKEQAALRARKEAEKQYQRELSELQAQIQNQQTQRNEAVSRNVDADAIYQQIQERFNQDLQQRQIQDELSRAADNYHSKMRLGRDVYSDFDEVTQDFDAKSFPELVYLVSGMENAADVIYDLSKNPMKLAALDRLAERNPKQAHNELLKLSRSIIENRNAQNEAINQNSFEPLNRLQASPIAGSNGKSSISDLRNQPWLQG